MIMHLRMKSNRQLLLISALYLYFLMLSYNSYVRLLYIQFSLHDRVRTLLVKNCQLCLPNIHFVVALLYLSVFPFDAEGLVWL